MNVKGLIFCSLLLAPALCRAQEGREPAEEVTPGEVVRVETDLVPVEVTVRDAAGQVVHGLRRSAFKLFEDGVERPISFFNAETTGGVTRCPLDLIFALDVSGSMTREEIGMLREAAALFAERLSGARTRFAVLSFGMRVRVLQPFTGDARRLGKAFDSALQDEMGLSTHAFDAVDDAVRMLARQGRKTSGGLVVKRVVVVISDGFPTGDTVSPPTVIERANAANVAVYTVTLPSYSYGALRGRPVPTILDVSGLTAQTGGVNVYATDRNYVEALKAISTEVLSRYILAFYPNREKQPDGNFHQLSVQVPDGMTASLSRRGYAGKGTR
ncbi:MAG: VWA domain-containing protein [Pyrinomonadaceae bacterium]